MCSRFCLLAGYLWNKYSKYPKKYTKNEKKGKNVEMDFSIMHLIESRGENMYRVDCMKEICVWTRKGEGNWQWEETETCSMEGETGKKNVKTL